MDIINRVKSEYHNSIEYVILEDLLRSLERLKLEGFAVLYTKDEYAEDIFQELDIKTSKSQVTDIFAHINLWDSTIEIGSIYHADDLDAIQLENPEALEIAKKILHDKIILCDKLVRNCSEADEFHVQYAVGELIELYLKHHAK